MATSKPFITANTVTLLRLLPMPFLCWLIYQQQYWFALILGTLVGCTDFIDGYLARKHGPTVLGGLMDPIADKVFIAFVYLPFCDPRAGSLFPAWAVALMFVREFFVTALRSAYERRDLEMTTTYLAKVKTWVQMQAIGLAMLFVLLASHYFAMQVVLIVAVVAPLVALAALWLITRKLWPGALVMSLSSIPLVVIHQYASLEVILGVLIAAIVGITWISGFDYIRQGVKQLRGNSIDKAIDQADIVRMVGAIALPCLLFATLVLTPVSPWPLAGILALELAIGGLDNLLSHHRAGASALVWGSRVFGTSMLLAITLIAGSLLGASAQFVNITATLAFCVTCFGIVWEFWRGRDYYLDAKLRDKERGDDEDDGDDGGTLTQQHDCDPAALPQITCRRPV